MYPKSLHIMTVLGGSPANHPHVILLCADTTAGGMWSPLTLAVEVAVAYSLFSIQTNFPSDILSLGSHVFKKIV
jgi:hypothetical protein